MAGPGPDDRRMGGGGRGGRGGAGVPGGAGAADFDDSGAGVVAALSSDSNPPGHDPPTHPGGLRRALEVATAHTATLRDLHAVLAGLDARLLAIAADVAAGKSVAEDLAAARSAITEIRTDLAALNAAARPPESRSRVGPVEAPTWAILALAALIAVVLAAALAGGRVLDLVAIIRAVLARS